MIIATALNAFFYGLGWGTVLSLMLGTVFFTLIQSSIDNGYKSGVLIAVGVIISDILFIAVAAFGASFIPDIAHLSFYGYLFGGIMLAVMGVLSFFKKPQTLAYPKTGIGGIVFYTSKGFFLNLLNPVNFFAWVGLATQLKVVGYEQDRMLVFFVGCLLAIFLMEVIISVFADKLKKYFSNKVLQIINYVSGTVFLAFGIRLIWQATIIF